MKKEIGIENNFLNSLEKGLEEDLEKLAIKDKEEREKQKLEIIESVKKILVEEEKKTEEKLKILYYWLFGVALVLLVIIIVMSFYLRTSQ